MNNKVVCGANSQDGDLTGLTVAEIKQAYKDILNIDDASEAIISGDKVDNGYRLADGDTLEFVKKSGKKGQ
jgi:hypothetical protein